MGISFEPMFAPWAVLVAAVAAGGLAWAYYRGAGDGVSPGRRRALLALRLGGFAALVFILSGPVVSRTVLVRRAKPLAVVVDTSESMATADGSADGRMTRLDAAKAALLAALPRLSEYELTVYGAAGGAEILASGKVEAGVSALLADGERTALGDSIVSAAPRKAAGAILLFSDGASNAGRPLATAAETLAERGIAVFCAPAGRAGTPNVAVKRVLGPRVLLRGEPSVFFVEVAASGGAGGPFDVILKDDDKVAAKARGEAGLVRVDFKPERDGDITYTVEVGGVPDEESTGDNRATRTVRVAKEKLKVLYVEDQPRWEYRFIKNAILRDERIDPKLLLISGDKELSEFPYNISALPHERAEIFKFDCIAVGDVASDFFLPKDIDNLRAFVSEGGGGLLFVAGARENPSRYVQGPMSELCPADFEGLVAAPVDGFAITPTDAGATNPALALGTGDQRAIYAALPKIFWLAMVKPRAGATVLAKSSPGDYPVVVEEPFGRGRIVLIATDELWRWRSLGGDRYLYRLWAQMVRYLGARRLSGGGAGELAVSADEYARGDEGEATAYLENGLGMPVDDAAAEGFLEDAGGARTPLMFSAQPGAPGLYRAAMPAGAPGRYTLYLRGPEGLLSAPFVVSDRTHEALFPGADPGALDALSARTGGKVLASDRILDILTDFPPEATSEPRANRQPLWASWWLVIPVAAFFSVEWYLRKKWGMM